MSLMRGVHELGEVERRVGSNGRRANLDLWIRVSSEPNLGRGQHAIHRLSLSRLMIVQLRTSQKGRNKRTDDCEVVKERTKKRERNDEGDDTRRR